MNKLIIKIQIAAIAVISASLMVAGIATADHDAGGYIGDYNYGSYNDYYDLHGSYNDDDYYDYYDNYRNNRDDYYDDRYDNDYYDNGYYDGTYYDYPGRYCDNYNCNNENRYGLPNLKILSATISDTTPSVGQTLKVVVRVTNNGQADVRSGAPASPNGFNVLIKDRTGRLSQTFHVDQLLVGQSARVELSERIDSDHFHANQTMDLYAYVDTSNRVQETNESDNTKSLGTIYVKDAYDRSYDDNYRNDRYNDRYDDNGRFCHTYNGRNQDEYLWYLECNDVIQDRNRYNPSKYLNRAEAAKMAVVAIGEREKSGNHFCDVLPRAWYAGYVERAFDLSIVSGKGTADRSFQGRNSYGSYTCSRGQRYYDPEDRVTRAEALKIIMNAFHVPFERYGFNSSPYSDIDGHWAEELIDQAYQIDLIGYNGGRFRPDENITRGEFGHWMHEAMVRHNNHL